MAREVIVVTTQRRPSDGQVVRLGRLVGTRSVLAWGESARERSDFLQQCVERHAAGDWGVVDAHDRRANDGALLSGGRLLSSYVVPDAVADTATPGHVWVITEADRRLTTLLWPSEY